MYPRFKNPNAAPKIICTLPPCRGWTRRRHRRGRVWPPTPLPSRRRGLRSSQSLPPQRAVPLLWNAHRGSSSSRGAASRRGPAARHPCRSCLPTTQASRRANHKVTWGMLEVSGGTACLSVRYALSHFIGQGPYFQTLEPCPLLNFQYVSLLVFFCVEGMVYTAIRLNVVMAREASSTQVQAQLKHAFKASCEQNMQKYAMHVIVPEVACMAQPANSTVIPNSASSACGGVESPDARQTLRKQRSHAAHKHRAQFGPGAHACLSACPRPNIRGSRSKTNAAVCYMLL